MPPGRARKRSCGSPGRARGWRGETRGTKRDEASLKAAGKDGSARPVRAAAMCSAFAATGRSFGGPHAPGTGAMRGPWMHAAGPAEIVRAQSGTPPPGASHPCIPPNRTAAGSRLSSGRGITDRGGDEPAPGARDGHRRPAGQSSGRELPGRPDARRRTGALAPAWPSLAAGYAGVRCRIGPTAIVRPRARIAPRWTGSRGISRRMLLR